MRLGDKLRRTLDVPAQTPLSAPPSTPQRTLREALQALKPQGRSTLHAAAPSFDPPTDTPPALMDLIPGELAPWGNEGEVWLSTQRLSLAPLHQRWGPNCLDAAHYAHLSAYIGDARLHHFDPRQALYLDIESTGLEHGAGTIAFMIGLGYLDGAELVLTQLILRDFEEERAQLSLFWEILDAFPYLVSFNGKSFDTSLLQSRLTTHRICSHEHSALKLRPHLDLLHLSRNTLRDTLPNVRLQTLEAELLDRHRTDDMPGALAPACWFHWLRWQDPRPLAAIAEHNRLDVRSMVELGAHLSALCSPRPLPPPAPAVWLNVLRTYIRRRSYHEALTLLSTHPAALSLEESRPLHEQEAILWRRLGDHARCVQAYERALAAGDHAREEVVRIEAALSRARRALNKARTTG